MGYKSKFEPAPFGNDATSSIHGDLYVDGEIYANSYHVDVVTKTITNIEQSGDTKFGDTPDDLHQFTGSMSISGSLYGSDSTQFGSIPSNTHILTGSWHMSGTSASFHTEEFRITTSPAYNEPALVTRGSRTGDEALGGWRTTLVGWKSICFRG